MNEHFDDMIRRRLEGHESNVPEGMFDAINNRPEVQDAAFDNAIRSRLSTAESAMPSELFNAINAMADLENLGFDSTIKEKMEGHASLVPADMWQRITAEKDRRRRPIAWWWLAATVLLILAGAGTVFLLQDKKQQPVLEAITQNKKMGEQPGGISSVDVVGKNKIDTDGVTNRVVEVKEDTTAVAKNAAGNEQNPDNNNSFSKVNTTVLNHQQLVNTEQNADRKNTANPQNVTDEPVDEIVNNFQSDAAIQTVTDANSATAHLSILSLLRNAGRLTPGQLLKAKPHAPVIPCPINGDEKRNDWYVEVYGSAFLLQKKIQDKDAGKNAKAGFDTTLHRQVSFNAGFNMVKNLGENFLLKTGLQYNRINESFRLTQINERRLITTISVRTVILAPGDTVRIRDTATIEQIGTAQRRTQNRYTQWDIPVIIGYEFGGENIRLNANAGIIANIRSSYRGEMLADSTKQIYDINNYNGQPIYRKKVGFSLYAGLSILKPLTEKMSLLIEPHARIGLGNSANSQAWFSQKNNTMGLSIGLRYKLGGSRQRIY